MSRVAKRPVAIPAGVEVNLADDKIVIKAAAGQLELKKNALVAVENKEGALHFVPTDDSQHANALAGTFRQLVNNMVIGTTKGFERKLNLVGVGYRAQAQGDKLNLSVGFSHPVQFVMPKGIKVATPAPTEIVLTGIDRQVIGQIAAEIRAVRPPEPYKGKGIRYSDERVITKEVKKK